MTTKKILFLVCLGGTILFVLLFASLFVACSPEAVEEQSLPIDSKEVTLYTGEKEANAPSTRTTINDAGDVFWSSSDVIFVNGAPSTRTTVTNDGLYAEFTANASAPYSAVYPASMVVYYSPSAGGWLYKIVLPMEQSYKNDISFADGVNPSIAYSSNENLIFQNLCGILRMQIKADCMGVRKVRFTSMDTLVSGLANVYVNSSSNMQSLEIVDGKNIVDVTFDFGRTFSEYVPIDVFWVLPVGNYGSGWTVSLLDSDDNVLAVGTSESFLISRSKITDLGELAF